MFIWTAKLFIPLIMSTGLVIGLVSYLGFFYPHLSAWQGHLIGPGVNATLASPVPADTASLFVVCVGLPPGPPSPPRPLPPPGPSSRWLRCMPGCPAAQP